MAGAHLIQVRRDPWPRSILLAFLFRMTLSSGLRGWGKLSRGLRDYAPQARVRPSLRRISESGDSFALASWNQ